MREELSNIFHDWSHHLVAWTRDRALKLIVILVVSFIFVRVLASITNRIIALSEKRATDGFQRAQQVRTVARIIRSAGIFLIVFLAGMSLLKDVFHFDIAPLLASAGIAGLAIGFGAQTLVKDVINGFFILLENQFQVGDTIRVAGVTGNVEEIGMRRTSLRDNDGTLHIVPNGAIQIVSNMTRDWSQVTLDISVDYKENSDRVIELLQQVAQEFASDPEFKPDIFSDPQVLGIDRIRGAEVDYLIVVKVRPRKQFGAARELRRRIKTSLEENNIKAGVPLSVPAAPSP
jgi:small conductance mechanosensitive channel